MQPRLIGRRPSPIIRPGGPRLTGGDAPIGGVILATNRPGPNFVAANGLAHNLPSSDFPIALDTRLIVPSSFSQPIVGGSSTTSGEAAVGNGIFLFSVTTNQYVYSGLYRMPLDAGTKPELVTPAGATPTRVTFGNGKFLVAGNTLATMLSTVDGDTYEKVNVPTSVYNGALNGIDFVGGMFVLIGTNYLVTSPDLVNWTAVGPLNATSRALTCVACSGNNWLVGTTTGHLYQTSNLAGTWAVSQPQTISVHDVAILSNGYCAFSVYNANNGSTAWIRNGLSGTWNQRFNGSAGTRYQQSLIACDELGGFFFASNWSTGAANFAANTTYPIAASYAGTGLYIHEGHIFGLTVSTLATVWRNPIGQNKVLVPNYNIAGSEIKDANGETLTAWMRMF